MKASASRCKIDLKILKIDILHDMKNNKNSHQKLARRLEKKYFCSNCTLLLRVRKKKTRTHTSYKMLQCRKFFYILFHVNDSFYIYFRIILAEWSFSAFNLKCIYFSRVWLYVLTSVNIEGIAFIHAKWRC